MVHLKLLRVLGCLEGWWLIEQGARGSLKREEGLGEVERQDLALGEDREGRFRILLTLNKNYN